MYKIVRKFYASTRAMEEGRVERTYGHPSRRWCGRSPHHQAEAGNARKRNRSHRSNRGIKMAARGYKTTVAALEVAHRKLLRLEKLALKRITALPGMDANTVKLKNELSETPQGVIEWKSFCTRWGYSPDHSAISFFPHWKPGNDLLKPNPPSSKPSRLPRALGCMSRCP